MGGARHLSDKRCAHSVHVGECAHRSAALSGQIPQPGTEPQICSRHSAVPASCQKWQLSNLWHHLRPFQRLKMIPGSVSISQVRSFMLAARICLIQSSERTVLSSITGLSPTLRFTPTDPLLWCTFLSRCLDSLGQGTRVLWCTFLSRCLIVRNSEQ